MELLEFCKGIALMPKAVEQLRKIIISEEEYQNNRALFTYDKDKFYERILMKDTCRILFLYYFVRMGCEAYEQYQKEGISAQIYWDTFYDITLWCQNCFDKYGEYGISEYIWFFRHIELRLFRLGRLQFEKMESPWNLDYQGTVIKKGDTVMNIHIPQGERLLQEQCICSCKKAFQIWGEQYPYLCYSWLLFPDLDKMLNEDSNILKFQELFDIVQIDYEAHDTERRIFDKIRSDPALYQEDTGLRRRAKQYLMEGNILGGGLGVLLKQRI